MVLKCYSARICLVLWLGALKPSRIYPNIAESEDGLGFVAVNALGKRLMLKKFSAQKNEVR